MKKVAAFGGVVLVATVALAAVPVQQRTNFGQQMSATVVLIDPLTRETICAGVVIAEDRVLTAKHCVNAVADGTVIKFLDGRVATGDVIARGADIDVALIAVDTGDAPIAQADYDVRVGDPVCAIGAPIGLEWTVSCGIVSAIRVITGDNVMTSGTWIQTDAAINGGNSGGPLFTPQGGVAGIVSWGYLGAHGLSFAVPIAIALAAVGR